MVVGIGSFRIEPRVRVIYGEVDAWRIIIEAKVNPTLTAYDDPTMVEAAQRAKKRYVWLKLGVLMSVHMSCGATRTSLYIYIYT